MIIKVFGALCALLLFTGCIFEPYRETAHYDLSCKKIADNPAKMLFYAVEFENFTSADTRMQLRDGNGRVITDPYAKWVLPPGELVPRALCAAFPSAERNAPERRITGRLILFEGNLATNTFELAGNWRQSDTEGIQQFHISIPLKGTAPADLAAAATSAVETLASDMTKNTVDSGR